ncbi:putative CRAL-TRIO lipid binding domain, CRAL/TRIO domain superfamily [Dioscorea sansibarensis]
MSIASQQEAIKQLIALMEQADDRLKATFKNMHQGYSSETVSRFLKAREWNLLDCLNWRIHNDIDNVLAKPIIPVDLYRAVRDSQLVGLSGYTKEGPPVFAIGVGMSTFDKASVNYYLQSHIQINEYRDRVILPAASKKHRRHISNCYKILDMTGLKLCALSQLKLLTIISTVDDLNYPEKTITYYIVNAPYVFSACWKAVKPLLHERTRKKVQVLQGSGRDELLKNSGSSRNSSRVSDCFSLDHPFHQQLYSYVKQQQSHSHDYKIPTRQGSYHFSMPNADSDGAIIVETIKSVLEEQR